MIRVLAGSGFAVREVWLKDMAAWLSDDTLSRAVCLVPEQLTLRAELDALDSAASQGSFALEVLSPTRLMGRVFAKVPPPHGAQIDGRGRSMALKAALQLTQRDFEWFGRSVLRDGFVEMALNQLAEFKAAGYSPEDIAAWADRLDGVLKAKLTDIALIYREYQDTLAGRLCDREDLLSAAADALKSMDIYANAPVWIYGFDMITPWLSRIAAAFAELGCDVRIGLHVEGGERGAMFADIRKTIARIEGVTAEHVASLPISRTAADLTYLADNALSYDVPAYPHPADHVRVLSAHSPYEECLYAAAVCRNAMLKSKLRYRDMRVMAYNLPSYAQLISHAFALYDVPVFLSEKRPALAHPAAKYLLAAFSMALGDYSQSDAQACLKSGFCPLTDEEAELLSTYATAHGLRGSKWRQPLTRGRDAEAIEPLRQAFIEPILALGQAIHHIKHTAAAVAEALKAFLDDTEVYYKLELMQARLKQSGERVAMSESAQMWNRLISTIEQMHFLLNDKVLPVEVLYDVLEAGLNETMVGNIPQSADAVEASQMRSATPQPCRLLIILGLNEQGAPSAASLFTGEESRAITAIEPRASVGFTRESLSHMRRVALVTALSQPRDYLLMSYAQADESGAPLRPDPIINWMDTHMPTHSRINDALPGQSINPMLLNAAPAAIELLFPRIERGLTAHESSSLTQLSARTSGRAAISRLLNAHTFSAYDTRLPRDLVKKLYRGPDRLSVSQLEAFAACPFSFFVRYGLNPTREEKYEYTPQDQGMFFHASLERFAKEVMSRGGFATMSDQDIASLMTRITDELSDDWREGPLSEDAVAKSRGTAIVHACKRAAWAVSKQFIEGGFRPLELEINFGSNAPAIRVDDVSLTGRIDRIDALSMNNIHYLRIADYKSGGRKPRLDAIYWGLQLQLITYLAAAVSMTKNSRPAGVHYFRVQDPVLEWSEDMEDARLKEMQLTGIRLDETAPRDGNSGGFSLTKEDMERTLAVADLRAREILAQLKAGDASVQPTEHMHSPCEYCDFAKICKRDARMPGCAGVKRKKIQDKDAIKLIRLATEGGDNRA